MAQFFINRPIFAWVLSIIIMLAGLMAIRSLPLEQYPDIAPPRVSITADYTGASAKTMEDSVTQVIEQGLKGLDNLLYMQSTSNASGARAHFADLRCGHRYRCGANASAEPIAAGDVAVAAIGAKQGCHCHQGRQRLPDDSLDVLGRQQRLGGRCGRLHHQQPGRCHQPYRRRGRSPDAGHRLCDAHLAGSGQTAQIQLDALRRQCRHRGAERPGVRRTTGRFARRSIISN